MERLSYVDKQRTVLEMGRNGENSAQTLDSLFALFASTRDTDNALRVSIVRAVKRVASKDPALVNNGVRRVAIVLASNDAIARAITLRLYALLVDHVDAIDTHHTIIEALESHDDLEYNAAIHAVHQSASTSMFLPEIVQKIMRIHDKQGPRISKKLIHILGRMNRHPGAARKAQSLCQRILKQAPPADTVIASLRSLTLLAIHVPFQIPSQIKCLIELLESSSNTSGTWITLACLDNLSHLAVNGAAHSFQSSHLKTLASMLSTNRNYQVQLRIVHVLSILGQSALRIRLELLGRPPSSPILDMDRVWNLIVDNRKMTESSSSSIYAAVDLFCMGLEGGRDERRGQIMEAIGSKIRTEVDSKKIRVFLYALLKVSRNGLGFPRLGSIISACFDNRAARPVLERYLPKVHSLTYGSNIQFDSPLALKVLSIQEEPESIGKMMTLFSVSLLFQSTADSELEAAFESGLCTRLLSSGNNGVWNFYESSKYALIGGHFAIASFLLRICSNGTASESSMAWLQILMNISSAEMFTRQSDFLACDMRWKEALQLYQNAAIQLRLITDETRGTRRFQKRFLELQVLKLELAMYLRAFVSSAQPFFRKMVLTRCVSMSKSLSAGYSHLATMFPDIDYASASFLGWLEAGYEDIENDFSAALNGAEPFEHTQAEKQQLDGLCNKLMSIDRQSSGFPAYFFTVESQVQVTAESVPALSEALKMSTVSGRIFFTVSGNVRFPESLKTSNGAIRNQMRIHRVCIETHNGKSPVVMVFESRLKQDGRFETQVGLGLEDAFTGRLKVQNCFVDCEGKSWKCGPDWDVSRK